MRVGIIGLGFVGNALLNGLNKKTEVFKVDPKLQTTISDLNNFNPEIIFICVPTPMDADGTQDLDILNKVISEINSYKFESIIVLKSTVLPSHIKRIENRCAKFIYNPEFLRENHASEDFINSSLIVFGGNIDLGKSLGYFYKEYTKCIHDEYLYMDSISASLIKYSVNSFLSTKVIFFNQLNEIFLESGSDNKWEDLTKALAKDPRIGTTHMNVPGHDGRVGFGGACFPKDTNAFYNYSVELKKPFSLLNEVIKINNQLRSLYNTETNREKDQNIKFK
jgi:UDPglucose 6-dehydrogenase